MKRYTQFIFLILILVRLSQANLPANRPKPEKQRFAIEPEDAIARVGEKIILSCRVVDRVGLLQWTKDGFGLGLDRALAGFPRYTMVGIEEEGDYSLEITNVQLEDDADYQCQVGASSNVAGIRSHTAKLTVFIPPEPVHIKEGEILDTIEGKQVTLNCESNGGKPVVEITWLDDNGRTIVDGVETSKQTLSDGKRSNTQSRWQFVAGKQHHNKRFTCRAENSALQEPQKASILIRVRFAPKVKLVYNGDYQVISNEPSAVQEENPSENIAIDINKENEDLNENIVAHVGENVSINCDAAANPNVGLTYKWYKDDQIFPGDHSTSSLNISSISADFNGVRIGCEVLNSIGSSGVIYRQLSVSFAPKFSRSLQKSYTANEGSTLKLMCEVRSNPPAEITWYFGSTVVGRGKLLQLTNMDYSKAGRYACIVDVKGFDQIQSTTHVQIKGAPRVISSPNQYGLEDEEIRIECVVQSIPKAASVVWHRNGQQIELDNKNGYELIAEPIPDTDSMDSMIRHLLVIRHAKLIDFGQYNCSATNELGTDSILITLNRQKTFPTLMIIASVVGASAAFLFIGLVVLIVMRKSSKTGDHFASNLKKQTAGTNSSMVLTNSNNTNSNFNKALTDSGRSHLTIDNGSSAANSDLTRDLKLEIRTSSSLSDQEHRNPAINWEDEMIMNHALLTANGLYNGQHVQAFASEQTNPINNVYDTQQFNQHFIITNGVAPNYESIYNYPPTAQLVPNNQLSASTQQQITLNMSQPINGVLNNNCLSTANKYSSPAKQQQQSSPPTYHNLTNLSSSNLNNLSNLNLQNTNNLYLPSYTDYGQLNGLIDYMQVQPSNTVQTSQQQTTDTLDSKLLGYTINSNGQPIITNLPASKQCESAYSTLQTDSRYRAQCANTNYSTRNAYTSNQLSTPGLPGLPSSPLYNNSQLSTTNNSAIQVPNNANSSTLRNYITNNQVNSSLGSGVNNQATLATHV